MNVAASQFDVRRVAMLFLVSSLLLLPFLLTLSYSSVGHRGMETELSNPDAMDTRMALAVLSAIALCYAFLASPAPDSSHALKRLVIVSLSGLVAFVVANAASFFLRGGESNCAYGFPFEMRKWGGGPNVINMDYIDYTAIWLDIIFAIVTSILLGALQLRIVRRASRWCRIVVLFALAAAVYFGVFACWWWSAKTTYYVNADKQVRKVALHQNEVMYLTQQMWNPAFWVVENIFGYRYVMYIAAGPDSEFRFEK